MRINKISKTALAKILSESVIDPRIAGPYKPIVDMEDPKFLRQRAIELLHEAEWGNSDAKMKQAITFLAIARYFSREQGEVQILKSIDRKINPNTRQ